MSNFVKNNDVAIKLRTEGDDFHQKGKYYDALLKYNESLCNAIEGSEDMGLVYANRSEVYFKLKFYDKAISNIQKALQNSYPEEKKKTLLERKERSETLLIEMKKEEKNDPSDFFRLSYNPNPKYPQFAECIELRTNEKFGRHLITNRDLNVGDIIAIEDFFYYSSGYSSEGLINYQICSFCLNSNRLDLHPCTKCAYTMYCDEKCYQQNLQRGHLLECRIIGTLVEYPNFHLIFKSFFTALSICRLSMVTLMELIEEAESFKKEVTIFDFDFSKMSQREKEKKFIQIMYLGHRKELSEEEKNSFHNFIEFLFSCDFATEALFKLDRDFIIKFMTRLKEVQHVNSFHHEKETPRMGLSTICVGKCICPGLTLTSHSCVENIMRVENGKRFAMVVIRKIKKGDQIFDCYYKNFMDEEKANRVEVLQHYGFTCDCTACLQNFPTTVTAKNGFWFDEAIRNYNYAKGYCASAAQEKAKILLKKVLELMNSIPLEHSYNRDFDLLVKCIVQCFVLIFYVKEKF